MPERRAVFIFSLIAIVVYAALTWAWAWSPVQRAYRKHFQAVGNVAFSQFWFWPQASASFVDPESETYRSQVNAKLPMGMELPAGFKLPEAAGVNDTVMLLQNNHVPGSPGFVRTSSRLIGFAPTAVLISLVIATPINLKKRWWLLFWGLIVVHIAIVLRLTVLLLDAGFADPAKKYALFHPGAFMADVINRARIIGADDPTFAYVLAVFVWVFVLFLIQCWYEWRPGKSKKAQEEA